MDFSFTQDQEDLRAHAKELLSSVCTPDYVARCDTEEQPPREAYEALGKQGWLGLIVPEEYGGTGGSAIDVAILLEEAGYYSEELAMWMFRTMTWGGYAVMTLGNEEQKKRILPKVAAGELSFCFGLSEPQSGSDAAALMTRADVTDGGDYVINGQKVFTSGMDISDYCLLATRTENTDKKHEGITNFLVDTKLPGIDIQRIATLGHRAIGTTQVFYSDVKVPADAVLGEVGEGWRALDTCLWYERLCLSAARTGAAQAAFEGALEYAKTREQFGKPIGKFQAISHKLADMKVMLDISRMLVYRFAWLVSEGKATRSDAAVIKLHSSEAYKTIADLGLQIYGGYGYSMEYPAQRFFRDSRLGVIGAGTSEIQRNIIARGLGL
ncbi:MAG: acyl-CoA/acyl-ACP dehydrogenase [Rhodospirillaceae bacterium]|jgi:alkylation response protein AidB-like acyl-CoA dehydrogenase|nr:acyl-CoA/acyl-ACP dehydrogenase [Rhodospirillales bacterium]MBT3906471.1 acyl-CoA/acyl-ACP dehydrogenase [Rhodospirillaceae bacterium]MBT5034278.1 acyl-CoA/acyl-ACP dehydrogenase [Rhodospirillaceae bacterium]MBT6218149.1 acyl-CoA/acyl-ACP dehydrogenase [Rhodospirillaceae bacterium]MBT6363278.1 acyl-CoA/acyl-ACP dehydrogenase [Rhodospirillaceae bacterium]